MPLIDHKRTLTINGHIIWKIRSFMRQHICKVKMKDLDGLNIFMVFTTFNSSIAYEKTMFVATCPMQLNNVRCKGENMIGGGKLLSQMVVFHTIINKILNATMI